MDFLEDLALYERAMTNAYFIITRKKTLDDIYYELEDETLGDFPLPFDFCAIAKAFGANGIRIEDTQKLGPAIEDAIQSNQTTVIDVIIDGEL